MAKRRGRRLACPECKTYLHTIGTNAEEYTKMEDLKIGTAQMYPRGENGRENRMD